MAIARRLGFSYRLLLADRDGPHLERQVVALRDQGYQADGVRCDITDPHAVRRLAEAAEQAGPVRALAHVVGLSPSMGDGPTILGVDLVGAALVANAFEDLARAGSAAVFIASLAAHLSALPAALTEAVEDPLAPDLVGRVEAAAGGEIEPGLAYSLAKFGVVRMCQRKAAGLGRKGARIVSVSPGLIDSPQGDREFEVQPSKRRLLEATPLGRLGTMVEIAEGVDFLLSDRASFVSGVDLLIDGGLSAAARFPAR